MLFFVRLNPEIFLWIKTKKELIRCITQLFTLRIKQIELSPQKTGHLYYAYISLL